MDGVVVGGGPPSGRVASGSTATPLADSYFSFKWVWGDEGSSSGRHQLPLRHPPPPPASGTRHRHPPSVTRHSPLSPPPSSIGGARRRPPTVPSAHPLQAPWSGLRTALHK
ncbi:hypothetical protein GCM10014715_50760 [Streptomyces spiralis]|uniref:Uncharacterized protein n=1 Tax=Streptomyces spiralis TaxID=66376 RepID=A0A919A800_9ACTN|nr:hypothetical protein GCM10014715_50760 [Streptomyces spiralis]